MHPIFAGLPDAVARQCQDAIDRAVSFRAHTPEQFTTFDAALAHAVADRIKRERIGHAHRLKPGAPAHIFPRRSDGYEGTFVRVYAAIEGAEIVVYAVIDWRDDRWITAYCRAPF